MSKMSKNIFLIGEFNGDFCTILFILLSNPTCNIYYFGKYIPIISSHTNKSGMSILNSTFPNRLRIYKGDIDQTISLYDGPQADMCVFSCVESDSSIFKLCRLKTVSKCMVLCKTTIYNSEFINELKIIPVNNYFIGTFIKMKVVIINSKYNFKYNSRFNYFLKNETIDNISECLLKYLNDSEGYDFILLNLIEDEVDFINHDIVLVSDIEKIKLDTIYIKNTEWVKNSLAKLGLDSIFTETGSNSTGTAKDIKIIPKYTLQISI